MNIEKYSWDSRIKELYYKHNGEFRYIVEDLAKEMGRDIDTKHVYYVVERIRKGVSLEALYEALAVMVPNIIQGRRSRVGHLYKLLRSFENKEQMVMSACCKEQVSVVEGVTETSYYCKKCKKKTKPVVMTQEQNVEIIRNVIKDLQAQDDSIIKNLTDMRGDKKEQERSQLQQQQLNLHLYGVVGGSKGRRGHKGHKKDVELTKTNRQVVEDMRNMLPQDREKLLKTIEAQLVDEKLKELGFVDEEGKEEEK
jgi:hypothetical protein